MRVMLREQERAKINRFGKKSWQSRGKKPYFYKNITLFVSPSNLAGQGMEGAKCFI